VVSYVLKVVQTSEHSVAILRALTQLADNLQAFGSPIDYERRRQIGQTPLLEERTWSRICRMAGTPPGGPSKLNSARLWIRETLTGGLVQKAPGVLRLKGDMGPVEFNRFALHIPPLAAELLDSQACQILDDNGCADEPLMWSPPTEWAELGGLPGPDPDSFDPEVVVGLLRRKLPCGEVAKRLGTTIDLIRLIARRHPPHVPCSTASARPCPKPVPLELMSPDRLRQLVVDERRTLHSLADEYDLDRKMIARILEDEGIRLPRSGGRAKHDVDADWLRTQYLELRRPLPDIAAEVGTTPPNVARMARRHGIPIRSRGGASHAVSLNAPPGFPDLLARAMTGQGGDQRVRRFQVMARSRNMHERSRQSPRSRAHRAVQSARQARTGLRRLPSHAIDPLASASATDCPRTATASPG
jgi:hypothetical protein